MTEAERNETLRDLLDQLHAEANLAENFGENRSVRLRLRTYALEDVMEIAGIALHRKLTR